MNNIQLYLTIGIPTITVVLAWLSSRSDNNRTNDKIDRVSEMLNAKMDREGASIRAEIIAMRNDHHKDNMALMGYMVPLHERMAKLESER